MKSVLFVCLGNICRSPSGEGIFNHLLKENHLTDQIRSDSAGTSAYHEGEPADGRMREHASQRGYDLQSLARQFTYEDFKQFDYIITMDESNYKNVLKVDPSGEYHHKVFPMVKFCTQHDVSAVPDPYFGGADGFELVLDIIEDGCHGLLKQIKSEL